MIVYTFSFKLSMVPEIDDGTKKHSNKSSLLKKKTWLCISSSLKEHMI